MHERPFECFFAKIIKDCIEKIAKRQVQSSVGAIFFCHFFNFITSCSGVTLAQVILMFMHAISRISLAKKLYFAFSVIGMVILILVTFSNIFHSDVRIENEKATTAFQNMNDVLVLERDFISLRRETEYYIEAGVATARDVALSSRAVLQKKISETAKNKALAGQKSFLDFTAAFKSYNDRIDPLFLLYDEKSLIITSELEPLGIKIREALTGARAKASESKDFVSAAMLGVMQEQFLLARNNVAQYLGDLKIERARLAERQIDLFRRNLVTSAEPIIKTDLGEVLDAVSQNAGEFRAILRRLLTVTNDLDVLMKTQMVADAASATSAAAELRSQQTVIQKKAQDALVSTLDKTDQAVMLLSIVALLAAILTALTTVRAVSKPITIMTDVMRRLSKNDFAADVPYTLRKDEIGAMANALQIFKENAARVVSLEASRIDDEARHQAARRASMIDFAASFEASAGLIVGAVSSAAQQLQESAKTLSHTASSTKEQAMTVASSAGHASINVESVSVSTEQLAASVHEIGTQMTISTKIAHDAVQQAAMTDARIRELADATRSIGAVVSLIRDIAAQTNLLALNATIEAARAGDAGRGFAVVAQEVKQLAAQTEKATLDISELVKAVQGGTGDAVDMISDIAKTIHKMSDIGTMIATAVDEQQATTRSIAENSGQAAQGTSHVSQAIGQVSSSANETGIAADQVLSSAASLSSESSRLSTEITHFLARIRAA